MLDGNILGIGTLILMRMMFSIAPGRQSAAIHAAGKIKDFKFVMNFPFSYIGAHYSDTSRTWIPLQG